MLSMESLLDEVTPLLGVHITLKAADELFFGDRLLYNRYSNEAPSWKSSGSGHDLPEEQHRKGDKNKDNKKGKDYEKEDAREKPTTMATTTTGGTHGKSDGLRNAIANAKETLKRALEDTSGDTGADALADLTHEVATLKKMSDEMRREIEKLRTDFQNLLVCVQQGSAIPSSLQKHSTSPSSATGQKPPEPSKDEDFDLFGSSDEEEDAEKERIKQERLKAYAEKKAKKPESVAKSSVILDIKPWDDTTDMQEMEKLVRAIQKDGLVWGGSKLVPLAYGIKVLQIICVVEDEKVSVDDLTDQIAEEISDHVQSVDVVAFNKI